MQGIGKVAERLEGLIMMSIHVPHQKVQDGHVHDIEQPSAFVVGRDPLDVLTVLIVRLPIGLPSFMIGPAPGMPPSFARRDGLGG